MRRSEWPVGNYGVRPAGPPDECLYCRTKVGEQHRAGCVIRQRTVVVRTIIEHTISVPEDWDVHDIEFTEGSSCSDNMIDALKDMTNALEKAGKCSCGMVEREYVREATERDEAESECYVATQPT